LEVDCVAVIVVSAVHIDGASVADPDMVCWGCD
jgi:hypothetical protein